MVFISGTIVKLACGLLANYFVTYLEHHVVVFISILVCVCVCVWSGVQGCWALWFLTDVWYQRSCWIRAFWPAACPFSSRASCQASGEHILGFTVLMFTRGTPSVYVCFQTSALYVYFIYRTTSQNCNFQGVSYYCPHLCVCVCVCVLAGGLSTLELCIQCMSVVARGIFFFQHGVKSTGYKLPTHIYSE